MGSVQTYMYSVTKWHRSSLKPDQTEGNDWIIRLEIEDVQYNLLGGLWLCTRMYRLTYTPLTNKVGFKYNANWNYTHCFEFNIETVFGCN